MRLDVGYNLSKPGLIILVSRPGWVERPGGNLLYQGMLRWQHFRFIGESRMFVPIDGPNFPETLRSLGRLRLMTLLRTILWLAEQGGSFVVRRVVACVMRLTPEKATQVQSASIKWFGESQAGLFLPMDSRSITSTVIRSTIDWRISVWLHGVNQPAIETCNGIADPVTRVSPRTSENRERDGEPTFGSPNVGSGLSVFIIAVTRQLTLTMWHARNSLASMQFSTSFQATRSRSSEWLRS